MKQRGTLHRLMMVCLFLLLCMQGAAAQELMLPQALLKIEQQAFIGNDAFEYIVLPDGLETIAEKAFADCSGLRRIYIPSSVTQIAEDAFEGCHDLTIVCAWDSYAAAYGAEREGISVLIDNRIPVTVSVSSRMCEIGQSDIIWTVESAYPMEGDVCQFTVMRSGEIIAQSEKTSMMQFTLGKEQTAVSGDIYAICTYEHAGGTVTQAISPKTQIVAEIDAALTASEHTAAQHEHVIWTLALQETAGLPIVQYTVSDEDGECFAQSGYVTSNEYRVQMTEAGVYTAQAVVVDGLGREITVQSAPVTVTPTEGVSVVDDPLIYRLTDDGSSYAVTGCDLSPMTVEIPAERGGLPVTEIAQGAFVACEDLCYVVVPQSVKRIGAYAFYGCELLETVAGAEGVEEIGEGAFFGCKDLKNITLSSAITRIPKQMMGGCVSLSSIEIPAGVVGIEEGAFADCAALTDVTLGEALRKIDGNAFAGCSSLRQVDFPPALESIGERAFAACGKLKALSLPESLQSIGDSAFSGCMQLKEVDFMNADTSIGAYAFAYCADAVLSAYGSGSVESWAHAVFMTFINKAQPKIECAEAVAGEYYAGRSMTWHAEVSYGVEPYEYAFDVFKDGALVGQSGALTQNVFKYTPPADGSYHAVVTVTDADGKTVSADTQLIQVQPAADSLYYLNYELGESGYIITGGKNFESGKTYDIVIPETIDGVPVTEISNTAFSSNRYIRSVVMPSSITTIGNGSFKKCSALEKVVLSEGLQSMGDAVFEGCTALSEAVLPYGMKKLGSRTFYNCKSLRRIVVPASVTEAGTSVLTGCERLEEAIWNAQTAFLPDYTFDGCTALKTLTISPTTTEIRRFALRDCISLAHVEGSRSLISIEQNAFNNCVSLVELNLTGNEEVAIGSRAFFGCTSLERLIMQADGRIYLGDTGAQDVNNSSAFEGCILLKSIRIRGDVGRCDFYGCTSLSSVTIVDAEDIAPKAFENCASLSSMSIRKKDEDRLNIGASAFENCDSLKTFPFGPSRLYARAFWGCDALESVTLVEQRQESVVDVCIGNEAFMNCTALRHVHNMEYVRVFFSRAFMNCVSLQNFGVNDPRDYHYNDISNKQIQSETFANCISLTRLHFRDTDRGYIYSISEDAFRGCINLTVTAAEDTKHAYECIQKLESVTVPQSSDLSPELGVEIEWGTQTSALPVVEANITVYNNKNGPAVSGDSWSQALSDAAAKDVVLMTYSSCMSVQYKGDSETVYPANSTAIAHPLGNIAYGSSKTATVLLECRAKDPTTCSHGTFKVVVNSGNLDQVSLSGAADVQFSSTYDGDLVIREDTTQSADMTVSGNVYVYAALSIDGARLKAGGNVYVGDGGSIKMSGSAGVKAKALEVARGCAVDMDNFSSIEAESVNMAGSLSILGANCSVKAESFSVVGSGTLNLAADGRIETESFSFNSTADHTALLTDGTIKAAHAEIGSGFTASENQTFVLSGMKCTLNVTRRSPLQRFAALAVDCEIGSLEVEGAGSWLGLPFECDHFILTEYAVRNELKNGSDICKDIFDKYIEAKWAETEEAEQMLAKEMSGWYSLSAQSIGSGQDAAQAATFAEEGLILWLAEQLKDSQESWSDVNSILSSITTSREGGDYTLKDGNRTCDVRVAPLPGLTISDAVNSAGTITCTIGQRTYSYVYSLNPKGIREGTDRLFEVMEAYAKKEYMDQLEKAVKEVTGKEYAKYALAIVKMVETSVIEEKEFTQVIAERFGKAIARDLISKKLPVIQKTVDFFNQWESFIKPISDLKSIAAHARKGDELPTDLMKQFVDLAKVAL